MMNSLKNNVINEMNMKDIFNRYISKHNEKNLEDFVNVLFAINNFKSKLQFYIGDYDDEHDDHFCYSFANLILDPNILFHITKDDVRINLRNRIEENRNRFFNLFTFYLDDISNIKIEKKETSNWNSYNIYFKYKRNDKLNVYGIHMKIIIYN